MFLCNLRCTIIRSKSYAEPAVDPGPRRWSGGSTKKKGRFTPPLCRLFLVVYWRRTMSSECNSIRSGRFMSNFCTKVQTQPIGQIMTGIRSSTVRISYWKEGILTTPCSDIRLLVSVDHSVAPTSRQKGVPIVGEILAVGRFHWCREKLHNSEFGSVH